jgi:murein DD-endopeptidase MepM/ murein hydrolase activator NlpD
MLHSKNGHVNYARIFNLENKNLSPLQISLNNTSFVSAIVDFNISDSIINATDSILKYPPYSDSYFLFSNKTDGSTEFIVYEVDKLNYLVLDLKENERVYTGKKEITYKRKIITGSVNKSLFASFMENKTQPEIVDTINELLAWEIDFHNSRRGDHYKIIYEEAFTGNISVGDKRILGIYYNHKGRDIYAINYNQNGRDIFYDVRGNSIKKKFLKAPLEYNRISSPYSLDRFHPVLLRHMPHFGTDYAAPEGTPIYAAGDGIITTAAFHRGNGNFIKIQHNNIYTTQYLHMQKFEKGIKKGVRVKQGDVIGYVGSTGLSTGPHLCYRFWKHGQQVDPHSETFPSAYPPVSGSNRIEFNKLKEEIISDLNAVKIPWINKILRLNS